MDVPHDQGYCVFFTGRAGSAEFAAKSVDAELAPAGGEVSGRDLSDLSRGHIIYYSGMCGWVGVPAGAARARALAPTLAFA
jgi:hypothetical protein